MQKFYKQAFSTSMLMIISICFGRPCSVWADSLKDEAIPQDRQGAIIENRLDAGNATVDSTPLQGKVEQKQSSGFSLFGRRWTSEEYRNLNYGILGVVMFRHPFSKTERVAQVFPDCPAALAGIKAGDIVVKYADHVVDGHENQRTTWHTADGIAGTHVDYTVRRRGQLITFDLIRMNIEDIPNSSIRRMYERMLRDLGPPGVVEEKLRKRHNEE